MSLKNIKQKINIKLIINIICLLVIIAGFGTSIYMLIVNRSLWVDEAAFAYSFSQRNLFNLTTSVFAWDQIAPIIYLYIVKIITLIFGNTEITLRLFSVASYVFVLVLSYCVAKKIFKMKYPLLPTAYISSMTIMLKYSNDFKVYIFDAVCVLLVIYLYYLYNNKKFDFKKLILSYMILIWASNPTCFFIGGVLSYEFLISLINKKYSDTKKIFIGIGFVLLSFIIYYLYWLRSVATSSGMLGFWENNNFPLIPTSIEDLKLAKNLLFRLANSFDRYQLIIIMLTIISFVIGLYKKEKYKIVILFSILITLFASYLNMFPVEERMWLFIYPILVLLSFDTLNTLLNKDKINNFIVLSIALFIVFSNLGIRFFLQKYNIYYVNEEANELINYVEENIKEDEKLYVYYYSIPVFEYKNGYNNKSIGKFKDNVIYGKATFLKNDSGIQPKDVINNEKLYILISHYRETSNVDMNDIVLKGNLELLMNNYETPLYYYTKNISNMKTKVQYKIKSAKIKDKKYILTLTIENIGDSILNHEFDNIVVSSRENEKIEIPINKYIYQNQSVDIEIKLDFKNYDEINLQLYNKEHYWFDELGIEPIKITRETFTKKG